MNRAALLFASVLLLAAPCAALAQASASSGWVNNQEGCWCGYQTSLPRTYKVVGKSSVLADRQAGADAIDYWNRYCTLFNVQVDSGNNLGGQNGTNELDVFISSTDSQSIYGFTMTGTLFGRAVMFPNANFGNFNECKDFVGSGCGGFNETDVVVNLGFQSGWTNDWFAYGADSDSGNHNPAIIQTTALHEVGHTLGFHHVFTLPAFGDSFSAMNYINDDSGKFVTRMDAKTLRAEYSSRVTNITDIAIYPFTFGNSTYAETYAAASSTSLNAGDSFTIDHWLIQNVGNQAASNVVVTFYLVPAGTRNYPQPTDMVLGTATFASAPVDAEGDQNGTPFTVPGFVPSGTYNIGAIATVDGSEDSTYTPGKPNNNRFLIGHGTRQVITVNNPNPTPQGISMQSKTVTDACAGVGTGGGDGVLDPGETLSIAVTATSSYGASATGVTATLSTTASGVTVTQPTSSFGTLGAGGAATGSPSFQVSLSPSIACGTKVTFTLSFHSSLGDSSETFNLTVGQVSPGPSVTLVNEAFEGGTFPPAGWTLTNSGTDGVWENLNHNGLCYYASSYPYTNQTGGTGLCADANSDCWGYGMDAGMITPAFSLSDPTYLSAQLQFKSDFRDSASGDQGWVDVTTDGATWSNLLYFDHQDYRGPSTKTLDLTPYLGQASVRVRFRYMAPGWDWWWMVDDVALTATKAGNCSSHTCSPPPCTLSCTATVPTTGVATQPVAFASTATPSNCTGTPSFSWTFGDGMGSTNQNPSHTYASAGTYSWGLTVSLGGTTCTKSGSIVVSPAPVCSVTCSATVPASGSTGQNLSFSSTATPSAGCSGSPTFAWTFGDSTGSSLQNPTHAYASEGTYPWNLTVSLQGSTCTQSGSVVVTQPCVLTCTADVPASSTPGASVAFAATATANHCTGTPTFAWTFGDGASSNTQNPSHSYSNPGVYNWTLAVSQGGSTCSKSGALTVANPPSVTLIKKVTPPFKLVVTGSNLQSGIRVYINGVQWGSVVWKGITKIQLTGAIKSAVPKGTVKTFRFVNPDGGETSLVWSW
jgi:PKD repeat protein